MGHVAGERPLSSLNFDLAISKQFFGYLSNRDLSFSRHFFGKLKCARSQAASLIQWSSVRIYIGKDRVGQTFEEDAHEVVLSVHLIVYQGFYLQGIGVLAWIRA